jgi:hypothetical protein
LADGRRELALVTRRFLKLKGWKDAERIVFGGGFSGSRVGELAIGRASVILKADKIKVEIVIIRSEPDEAGLLGAVHLAPAWIFRPMTPSWRFDAVVQGVSEVPSMQDVQKWAIFTIGTGLGNALFLNRKSD